MTRSFRLWGALAALCAVAGPVRTSGRQPEGGTITGHVRLEGPAPGNPVIRMGVDPGCAQMNGRRVLQEAVLRDADGGLANAFVDLEGSFSAPRPPREPVILDQRRCLYAPRVTGARVGQVLRVRNSDPVFHNVHSLSTRGNAFNFSEPSAGAERDIVLKGPDVLMRIKCDVHSWMVAYVGVETHPYFAVSARDGSFAIHDVPPGRHTVRVWHERYGQVVRTVTVAPGSTVTIDVHYTGAEKPNQARVQDLVVPLVSTAGG